MRSVFDALFGIKKDGAIKLHWTLSTDAVRVAASKCVKDALNLNTKKKARWNQRSTPSPSGGKIGVAVAIIE